MTIPRATQKARSCPPDQHRATKPPPGTIRAPKGGFDRETANKMTTAVVNDTVHWVNNPEDALFKVAMKRKCEVCGAKPGRPCWNTLDDAAPLPNQLIHFGRTES